MNETNTLKWNENPKIIFVLLIVFFPLGLYFMWKNSIWSKKTRWIVTGIISIMVIGNGFNGQGSKNPGDLIDLSGTYNFNKSRMIMGEQTSMKSTLILKKDSNSYNYIIDEVTWTGYGNVIGKGHFEGKLSDKISSEYNSTLEQLTYEWKLQGKNELVERGGYFELSDYHFDIKNPSNDVYLHLSFSEGRGDSQSFKRE